jgi:hypothetical protein
MLKLLQGDRFELIRQHPLGIMLELPQELPILELTRLKTSVSGL